MNPFNRRKNLQSAQAMVEFALVMPVLMLLILGIIASGHLFFVYTTVVSASREASRWGMASGVSPSGVPRYKDCAAIRAAAVRVGGVAGVRADQVTIGYDHGPDDTSSTLACPYDAELYDRIKVSVTVNYKPIVPLVNIPSFPLVASSSRTIIMGQQIGAIPEGGVFEPTTTIKIVPSPDSSVIASKMGVTQSFNIIVASADNTVPTGTVTFKDTTTNQNSTCGASFAPPSPAGTPKACSFTFNSLGAHTLVASYTPTGSYVGAQPAMLVWVVSSKLTATAIGNVNLTGYLVDFTVHVAVKTPDTGKVNLGNVVLTVGKDTTPIASAPVDSNGDVTFSDVKLPQQPQVELIATYEGNASFGSSKDTEILNPAQSLKIPVLTLSANPPNSVKVGDKVTFTLKLAAGTQGNPLPTGTVIISDNANPNHACSALIENGTASCGQWSYTKSGSYTVTAAYNGDDVYKSHSQTMSYSISSNASDTQLAISVSPSTGFANIQTTITVDMPRVNGSYPTGAINITGEGGLTCPNPIQVDGNGRAVCTHRYIQVNYPNPWKITAEYVSNDPDLYKNTSSNTNYVVEPNDTYIQIRPNIHTDAFALNNTVNFEIEVISTQGGVPTGKVNVTGDAGINCQNITLVNGKASCSRPYSIYDTYRVTAEYISSTNVYLNSGPTNYYYYAWPLGQRSTASKCPKPPDFKIDFTTAKEIRFNVAAGNQIKGVQGVDVYWSDITQANLQEIRLVANVIYSDSGRSPTVAKNDMNSGTIKINKTPSPQQVRVIFDQTLGLGLYVIQVRLEDSCTFTVRDYKN